MSKKVITLATASCGYCRMLKQLVDSRYPNAGEAYEYVIYSHTKTNSKSAEAMLNLARKMGVSGVPFTALVEGRNVISTARGYDPKTISSMIEEAIASKKKDDNQLEIEFPSEN